MAAPNAMTAKQVARLIGTTRALILMSMRTDLNFQNKYDLPAGYGS